MKGVVGVSHILRNDAPVVAIVSDRVYITRAPQKKQYPYIILEKREIDPIISKSGEAEIDTEVIGVVVYCDSEADLINLSSKVRDALDHKASGTYNTVTIEQLIWDGSTSFDEEETNKTIFADDHEFSLRVRV